MTRPESSVSSFECWARSSRRVLNGTSVCRSKARMIGHRLRHCIRRVLLRTGLAELEDMNHMVARACTSIWSVPGPALPGVGDRAGVVPADQSVLCRVPDQLDVPPPYRLGYGGHGRLTGSRVLLGVVCGRKP